MRTPARSARKKKKTALAGTRAQKLAADYRAALEQQAATAEILRIIASSGRNATPVFEAITRAGAKLMPDTLVALFLMRDGRIEYPSHTGLPARQQAAIG